MLAVEAVTKRFGGLLVLDAVSLQVGPGEIVGLIGPNGSGKTTLFDVINGLLRPEAGRVFLDGRDISDLPPQAIARAGVARTYQVVQPLPELSLLENVAVGACFGRSGLTLSQAERAALVALDEVGLTGKAGLPAGTLSLAEKRRLELARAMAGAPSIILLDEALAGLSHVEAATVTGVLRGLRERGVGLLIIEHLMQAMTGLCDRIIVLDSGRVIASGRPIEVTGDPKIVEAYLGDPGLVQSLLEEP